MMSTTVMNEKDAVLSIATPFNSLCAWRVGTWEQAIVTRPMRQRKCHSFNWVPPGCAS